MCASLCLSFSYSSHSLSSTPFAPSEKHNSEKDWAIPPGQNNLTWCSDTPLVHFKVYSSSFIIFLL